MAALNNSDGCRPLQPKFLLFNSFRKPCNHPNLYHSVYSRRSARVEEAEIPSACWMRIVESKNQKRIGLPSRRDLLIGFGAAIAAGVLPRDSLASNAGALSTFPRKDKGENHMSTITTKDGTTDLLQGLGQQVSPSSLVTAGRFQPTIGTHRCCSSAQRGYRVIAHDRRGTAVPARPGRP